MLMQGYSDHDLDLVEYVFIFKSREFFVIYCELLYGN